MSLTFGLLFLALLGLASRALARVALFAWRAFTTAFGTLASLRVDAALGTSVRVRSILVRAFSSEFVHLMGYQARLVLGLFVSSPLDDHFVDFLQIVAEAHVRMELDVPFLVVGQRLVIERVRENEHDRVVSSVVVRVDVGMSMADFLQDLEYQANTTLRTQLDQMTICTNAYLDKNFRLVVLGVVPIVEVSLPSVVDHLHCLIDRLSGHNVRYLVVFVQVKSVRKVDGLNLNNQKQRKLTFWTLRQ